MIPKELVDKLGLTNRSFPGEALLHGCEMYEWPDVSKDGLNVYISDCRFTGKPIGVKNFYLIYARYKTGDNKIMDFQNLIPYEWLMELENIPGIKDFIHLFIIRDCKKDVNCST